MTLEEQVNIIKRTLVELAGAIVATRRAVNMVANQPTMMLGPSNRQEIFRELSEGVDRIEKALGLIEQLEPPNE